MDSIFGRKKARPRQSSLSGQDLNERSVPYDKLAPPPRSPIPVATVNQGLRGISAPNTNPALTTLGTEHNKFTVHRSKLDREGTYDQHPSTRQGSPSTSISTADSSTLYDEYMTPLSTTAIYAPQRTQTSRVRNSEASSSSSRNSSLADFGQFAPSQSNDSAATTVRPISGMTTRSETKRGSHYAASSSSEGGSHLSHFYHRHHAGDSFNFPRPDSEEEIEALFEKVRRTRDLGDLDLPIDQKWHMVHNDEHIRWKEERAREEQSRKQNETGQPAAIMAESPEWYLKKFLDKTIIAKQAGSLLVSLRSKELRFVQLEMFIIKY
jgi:cytokinesis protein